MAMTAHADDHFGGECGRDHDHNLRRARVAGYVLLAGLLLEAVCGIIWFRGVESLASLIAVTLVAGGVLGEIIFENRARLGGQGLGGQGLGRQELDRQGHPHRRRAPHQQDSRAKVGLQLVGDLDELERRARERRAGRTPAPSKYAFAGSAALQ
ncbi:hypothetical protein JQ604_05505 [Bradyrhizobium jicamae]|uniref:hypothetical protein n=1 Tax=Bradyrhizobium jicamae TaxID=280332 RepID=UPI001BACFAC3|nr:hypothetical protein [Bradyrhizobium jicamae]MBR0751629.1 hypothetical protein [Bradyrhizobium jicamae]